MIAPCGKPMKANRFGAAPAGVCAQTVAAGFIASRSGSAMVAPTPFNTARRETCFLDRYIGLSALNAKGKIQNANTAAGRDVSSSLFCILHSAFCITPSLVLRDFRLTHRRCLGHPAHPELI